MDKKKTALLLAIAIAAPAEGLRQRAYADPAQGVPTICFGHTGNVAMTDVRSVAECEALLTEDMRRAIQAVDTCRPGLPTNVLAAFADAAFNIGEHIACDSKRSTAARKLAAGDYAGACNELPKWDKARVAGVLVALPGLTKRRKMEQELCLSSSSP